MEYISHSYPPLACQIQENLPHQIQENLPLQIQENLPPQIQKNLLNIHQVL